MLPTTLATTFAIPKNDDAEERDFETRIVPEIHIKASSSVKGNGNLKGSSSSSRRTIVGPAEKENRRMKRLLRNRVSAQQARERRKAYLIELESKTKLLEQKNAEFQERVSTLQRENFMLRQIVKNTTMNSNPSSVASVSNLEA